LYIDRKQKRNEIVWGIEDHGSISMRKGKKDISMRNEVATKMGAKRMGLGTNATAQLH